MTDNRDPIAACIDARARDLHAALADAVDGTPHWRLRARRLLHEIAFGKAAVAVCVLNPVIPKADTDVSPGILELIRLLSPDALKELRPHLFEYRCADGDVLILEERLP